MAFSTFRLLVYSIVFLILIYLISTFFFFPLNPMQELNEGIEIAEKNIGKFNSIKINFPEETIFSSRVFNSPDRFILFECNYDLKCDPTKIQVDFNSVKIISPQEQVVSFRCIQDYPLNQCKIYFGQEPAQINLLELNSKKEFNLDSEKAVISFTYSNSGAIDAEKCIALITVKKEETSNNRKINALYSEKKIDLGSVFAGEKNSKQAELNLLVEGKYLIEFKISCPEAGTDYKEISFNASKSITSSNCKAIELTESYTFGDKVFKDCLCEECIYAFECMQKCNEKYKLEFEMSSPEKATAEYIEQNGINGNGINGTEPVTEPPESETTGEKIVEKALQYIGAPYVFGGKQEPTHEQYPTWAPCYYCLKENCRNACLINSSSCKNCIDDVQGSAWNGICASVCVGAPNCPENCRDGKAPNTCCDGEPRTNAGFDCSGLVSKALKENGISFVDGTKNQFIECDSGRTDCEVIQLNGNLNSLQKGDLIYYGKNNSCFQSAIHHVSIYKGKENEKQLVVEALGTDYGVTVSELRTNDLCKVIRFK
jgi:cell wall-associated NlpC family hydrolase